MTIEDEWVVGHKVSRWERPDLMWEPSNWQAEHRDCSDATGWVEARAKAAARHGVFPTHAHVAEAKPSPVSLPEDGLFEVPETWTQAPVRKAAPATPVVPIEVRDELKWDPVRLAEYEWLRPFLIVPDDASPPLAMSLPPEDAVGSYGADAIAWIEDTQKIKLRWWQGLAITRKLEHRADGSLCHRNTVESAPRRAGKSVGMRGGALWRMEHGEALFGEIQTIIHTGSDINICREIQRGAWRWAQNQWGEKSVTKGNGKEAIESTDGARWMVRAQEAVYGYDVMLGLVDEAWDVKPDTVTEGLEPAMLERQSPQLQITSTAHRRATSLMRTYLRDALTIEDPETLLLLWAAPHGSDPSDPAVWRAASPHWSEDRRKMIAAKYEKAAAGQSDPEFDDPDPMAGFIAQYLNIWSLRSTKAERGVPVVDAAGWRDLVAPRPGGVPAEAAIEGWPGEGLSVALAWRAAGRVLVTATAHEDLPSAAAAVRASGFRGTVAIGKALAADPAVKSLRRDPHSGRTGAAVAELVRLIEEGIVRHDGSDHLARQLLAVRTLDGTDGLRMASTARADAVKAAVWAIERARRPRPPRRRIVTAA